MPHLAEQEALQQMVFLRNSGSSYGEITAWLNQSGIKTKNRANRWERPTVYKILKNAGEVAADVPAGCQTRSRTI